MDTFISNIGKYGEGPAVEEVLQGTLTPPPSACKVSFKRASPKPWYQELQANVFRQIAFLFIESKVQS